MATTLRAAVVAACGIVALACAEARGPSVTPNIEALAAPVDSLRRSFTVPSSVHETQSGLVVLNDLAEEMLLRERIAGDTLVPVTTRGQGPLEVRMVQRIHRGPGDSLWVMDLPGNKVIVLDHEGRPVREMRSPFAPSVVAATGGGGLRAISTAGDWYVGERTMRFAPTFEVDDSLTVVRWRQRDGTRDTLARIAVRPINFTSRGTPPTIDAFTPIDAWGVFRDGRVIVVRPDYAIELIDAGGIVTRAGRGPAEPLPLTRADAELTRDSLARQRAETLRMMPGNPMGGQVGVTSGGRPAAVLPDPLPEHWPLLRSDLIAVDRQDRAWVKVRTAPRDTGSSRYDLFDRDGRYLRSVTVEFGGGVVGFGREFVYVRWPDADGLSWVKRHPLP